MSSEPIDSRTQSGGHLPATARSHALRYAERGHAASRGRDLKALAYYRTRGEGLWSEWTVGLEDQAYGFVEVGSSLLERRPLGVGTRQLFHEGDVAFRHLLEHGGQLKGHGTQSNNDTSVMPNGSRLSCGAKAGRRKRPVLRYPRAGAQTYGSLESRPRQLQALVRPHTPHYAARRSHARPAVAASAPTNTGPAATTGQTRSSRAGKGC